MVLAHHILVLGICGRLKVLADKAVADLEEFDAFCLHMHMYVHVDACAFMYTCLHIRMCLITFRRGYTEKVSFTWVTEGEA